MNSTATPIDFRGNEPEMAPRLRHSWLMRYRDYRVFSWPWVWRRTVLFGACSIVMGLVSVLIKASDLGDAGISTEEFFVGVGALLALVIPCPLLACMVRSRRWKDPRENAAVMAAFLAGGLIFAAYIETIERPFELNVLAPRMVATRLITEKTAGELYGNPLHSASGIERPTSGSIHFGGPLWRAIYDAVLFMLFSGGMALPTFFGEKRFLAEQARQRQLDELCLQIDQADMQLMVLQAQIEPHFLFNTLASLRSFIHDDSARAIAMVDALVEHLRATIPQMREGGGVSTLAQQLAICRSYLDLMRLRMSRRLEYSIDVPEALLDIPFPPLMLLTLVENAIKHGIEPKRGAGSIRILGERRRDAEGCRLVVQVIDDGVGLQSAMGHGVGLSNIRSQLALRYRGGGSLSLVGRLEGGAIASLEIPEPVADP